MKSILTLLVFTFGLLFSNQSYSQEKNISSETSVSKSERQRDYYVEKLNLNQDQAQKFNAINKNYKSSVNALKIKSKSKKSVKQLKTLEEKRDKEIKEILSNEQFKKYLELRRAKRKSLKTLIRKSNSQ